MTIHAPIGSFETINARPMTGEPLRFEASMLPARVRRVCVALGGLALWTLAVVQVWTAVGGTL